MLKPLVLALTVCLSLAGCEAFTTSKTWSTVMKVRPDGAGGGSDASTAYAAKLHGVLKGDSVEHKVVTYQYHYTTPLREEAVGTHTAVIYRDNSNQQNPWWLMEDRLQKPVWLPGEDLQRQVAFYLHHKADVVEQKSFHAGGSDDKQMVAVSAPPSNGSNRTGASRLAHFRSKPAPSYYELAAAIPSSAARNNSSAGLFRAVHGTNYDPSSALDRRKMDLLKSEDRQAHPPLAAQTF